MGLDNLKHIKPKNKAKILKTASDIQIYLNDTYSDIPDKSSLKYVVSFILFVCCLVEEAYSKKKIENKKVNKKDEVFNHMSKFLNVTLNDQDKKIIGEIIEDLHSSQRIKKVSLLQKFTFFIASKFLKKTK
jgi:hypothetical protein